LQAREDALDWLRQAYAIDPDRTVSKLLTDPDYAGLGEDGSLLGDDDLGRALAERLVKLHRERRPFTDPRLRVSLQLPGDWYEGPCKTDSGAVVRDALCLGPRFLAAGEPGSPWPVSLEVAVRPTKSYRRALPLKDEGTGDLVKQTVSSVTVGGLVAKRLEWSVGGTEGSVRESVAFEVPRGDEVVVLSFWYTLSTMAAGDHPAKARASERKLLEEIVASLGWE
jgi:hypothetical protein